MVLIVNGLDMMSAPDGKPYIAYQGFKWQRQDADGANAGRVIENALMHRDRLAIKVRLDITCRIMPLSWASRVLAAIEPESFSVTYTDFRAGGTVSKRMYSNNVPCEYCIKKDGIDYIMGLTFPLIEM